MKTTHADIRLLPAAFNANESSVMFQISKMSLSRVYPSDPFSGNPSNKTTGSVKSFYCHICNSNHSYVDPEKEPTGPEPGGGPIAVPTY